MGRMSDIAIALADCPASLTDLERAVVERAMRAFLVWRDGDDDPEGDDDAPADCGCDRCRLDALEAGLRHAHAELMAERAGTPEARRYRPVPTFGADEAYYEAF